MERKAKVDALWAEMNLTTTTTTTKSNQNKSDKPLDDISTNQLEKVSSITSVNNQKTQEPSRETTSSSGKRRIQRPKSNLSDLVSQYNIKVPKINTLEKSRLDWQGYVEREGIKEDLKFKNKDGYMEKVAFLQRVDDRRWNDLKQGQKQSKR
ncbi:bucentaur or craniofacial development-domain-containing protein [Halteromyces radiatus]|uniref:bucentaur or craniofacial development-domain-containing protein n=1 Tax=Halteromyces radiatus TaxID=101107 RepID=UPI00221E50F9|nr:bucentaur or craniofacial development-domain-containing protein [Halteromyces radiatus]KAI8089408.1 bucentaur or craniofacial development-domain-containing protein [Halteromyces radiatus]